ncbi:MAG: hypothetical protein PHV07_07260 [Oscillospiraceae bacterium]|nr:hypothetical protein [Oscillospiraceae bacterium]
MIDDNNKSDINNNLLNDKESTPNKSEYSNTELPIGISLGLCIGVALGAVFNNIVIGTTLGVCVGAFIGHLIRMRNN